MRHRLPRSATTSTRGSACASGCWPSRRCRRLAGRCSYRLPDDPQLRGARARLVAGAVLRRDGDGVAPGRELTDAHGVAGAGCRAEPGADAADDALAALDDDGLAAGAGVV